MRYRSLTALLGVALLAACDKNAVQEIAGPLATARVKFFNFGVNAPQVNFYANDTKMTAISSTTGAEAVLGVAYGAVSSGGFYAAIAPGQYALTGKIAAATDKDLVITTVNTTIADGKHYSFYVSGFYNTTTKSVEAFVVEDPVPAEFDFSGAAQVRFVNAISNSNPMTLYARNPTTGAELPIGSAVPYKAAGAFVAVPNGVYDIITRYAGSSTNVITRTTVSFVGARVYTISARGDITVTSTTAVNRPFLDQTANR